jgi:three-Cys-motif partner protein
MQVEWEVLKTIAETQAIDLWLLVPLGIGVNRMMPQRKLPEEKWAARLTAFFGSEEWKSKFYAPVQRNPTLFDDLDETVSAGIEKNVSHDQLAAYFIDRLKEIFAGVAKNPIVQRNSVNSPMFLLCFAAGNPRGAPIAVRIAEHLLRKWNGN